MPLVSLYPLLTHLCFLLTHSLAYYPVHHSTSYLFTYQTILTMSSAALNALKRKKRLDKQLQQIDGTLSTIEFQREALENAQTNTEVLRNMSYAAKALKTAHQHL